MKINLIGPYPPPYGGVSIHIKRLKEVLSERYAIEVFSSNKLFDSSIKNCSLKKLLIKLFFIDSKEIIHVNFGGKKEKIFLGWYVFLLRKKIIMTVHGEEITKIYMELNFILKKIYKFSLQNLSHVIVVNDNIKKECLNLGVKEEKVSVISPYINPVITKKDYLKIDKEVWDFIENSKKRNEKIITGNGNIRFFNNEDLYGLDLLVELIYLLKKDGYKVSLLFALLGYESQTKEEKTYFENLLEKIEDYQIKENIFIYKVKDTEYYPILNKSDIFIRSTNTDGYGISVTEAIYLKKPAIASDVCQRQNGTIYFKSRDIKDLLEKTKFVLNNYTEEKGKLEKIEVKEYYEDILEVYKKVCRGK